MTASTTQHSLSKLTTRWRFVLLVSSISFVWLLVLPWLAKQPLVNTQLQWLDEQRIDPSAMYYTELEAMKPILARLNERERAASRAVAAGPALTN